VNINWTKVLTYVFAFGIWVGTYYALVIYPYSLDADVKLWLTGGSGTALLAVFGDQIASRTEKAASATFDKGLSATPNDQMPTVTVDSGPPATATVTPAPATPEEGQG
jgi:hypothetical protein